jgi:hypothetical protein
MSTTREVAEEVLNQLAPRSSKVVLAWRDRLLTAIGKALTDRDERAARILETAAMLASPVGVIPETDPEHEPLARVSRVLMTAAAAIRQGSTDAE